VVYLVLAAQFESWVHPLVIMLTVPLAMAGALFGLWLTGQTLNIYSEIGLIMLVGLSAKNGILIVEFANQLRDQGKAFRDALLEAADVRLRPIVMTGITTAAGSIPLLLSTGAGAETRVVIGTVILSGVLAATLFTLFVVPVAYDLLARRTGSAGRRGAAVGAGGGWNQLAKASRHCAGAQTGSRISSARASRS
jgi:multidrug efflux pump